MAKLIKIASLLILLCFIASTLIVNVNAQVVGVSKGNVFEYDMVDHWSSTLDTLPAEFSQVNQTDVITVTVTDVNSTAVSSQVSTSYLNGTQQSADVACNIDTGDSTGGPPFIGANRGVNDLVNPSASDPWYINQTVTRTYKDSSRQTNYFQIEYNITTADTGEGKAIFDYYFDKSTGVLVDYTATVSHGDLTNIMESKLLASNVWSVGDVALQAEESPAPTSAPTSLYIAVAVVAIIILVAAVALILKKRGKTESNENE
jgi:hypothetical protein